MRCFFLVLWLVCLASPAVKAQSCNAYPDPKILIVGDSWSQIMHEKRFISTQLNRVGYSDWKEKGDLTAFAGSTASMWSDPLVFPIIHNEIVNNPSIEVVVVLIGGNDLLAGKFNNGWYVGMPGDQETALYNRIESQIRTMINGMKAARPGIKIVICGYDYLNFAYSVFEPGTWIMWDNLGQPTPRQINDAIIKLEQRKVNISNEDPDVSYVHNLGRMQRKYGYEGFFGANISPLPGNKAPNYLPFPGGFRDFPSSKKALGGDGSDPIHLNDAGYTEVAKQLVNHFFLPLLKENVNAKYTGHGKTFDGFLKPNNTKNNTNFRLGRDGAGLYRNVVSFNTAPLPDNAVVQSATIFLARAGATLTKFPKPLDKMDLRLDVKMGFFGNQQALEPMDYNATADIYNVGCFTGPAAGNGAKLRIDVDPSALQFFNTTGHTQFRFYINESLSGTVYYIFHDGDAGAANKPVLELTYTLPGQREQHTLLITPEITDRSSSVRVFPNPVKAGSVLYLETGEAAEYFVTDILGRVLMQGQVRKGKNVIAVEPAMPPGMYRISLNGTEGMSSYPFVIAR